MNTIVTHNGKPIYNGDIIIDWWKILHKVVPAASFDEYRSRGTIDGMSIQSTINAFDIKVWKYNPIQNDWILQ